MITIPGKIPIRIHPFFFLIALFISFMLSPDLPGIIVCAAVVTISILWHEYGHALTAMAFGQKTEILLMGMGGLTTRKGPQLRPWQEFLVVMNGPLFGFSLWLLSYKILSGLGEGTNPTLILALVVSTFINFWWSVLNLMPVGPLDGGKILAIVLEALMGPSGLRISLIIGMVLGGTLTLAGFLLQQPFLGMMFAFLSFESYRMYQGAKSMTRQDRLPQLQAHFQLAEQALQRGEVMDALERFQQIRNATGAGILFTASTEYCARILSDQGEFEEAFFLLKPLEKTLAPDGLRLLHRLAHYSREPDMVVRVGRQVFDFDSSHETAFINAIAHARRGEAHPCVGWLRTAIREGLSNVRSSVEKAEFDPVRQTKDFQNFLSSLPDI